MRLTDDELRFRLGLGESDGVEKKAFLTGEATNKVREAICAFANNLPGHTAPGVIFVGVADKWGGHRGSQSTINCC